MANSKIIDSKILQELTNKLQDIINNYCWNFENYSDEDIEGLFDGTGEEIDYYFISGPSRADIVADYKTLNP